MSFRKHSYDLLWLSIALLILLSLALLLPLSPQDYWWYLRLGQDVAQSGSVPTVDTYSFTQAGTSFFYQSWLAALVFWKTYQAGGLVLTFFLRAVVIAITYTLLWILVRNAGAGPRLASLLTILAALAGSSNWSFRPQLFIYPIFVLTLFILAKWTQGEKRGLWLLPVLSMLWVNLHGSFPLLFVLGAFAFVFGKGNKKQLAIAFVISALTIFINPHGIYVLGYVKDMLSAPSNQQFSVEWMPMVNRGWQANLFFAWLLIFAPLAALSPRKLSLLEWVNFIFFGWLALLGIRYVIWFIFIMVILTASLLAEFGARYLDKPIEKEKPVINIFAACLLLLIPFSLLPGFRDSWWPDAPRAYDNANPIEATEWLASHPELTGPLWSDFSYSSYLIFALPSRPVWIDTRFELYPPEQWEKYIAIANASPQWENLLGEENIQLVMLSAGGEPLLITAMKNSNQWCGIYRDEDAMIFSKSTGGCQ
ncbi:MAG: hypothetical protein HY863_01605 [Chloroflexi bacterium]|nr:hypothetical protein [Chloroflexota bacterium]